MNGKPPPPIPLAEAQAKLLAMVAPLPAQDVPTEEALGRYLASPLMARRTQPSADLSAMDGYAMQSGDETAWNVIGESAAGHPFTGSLKSGDAVRISTGAMMPDGANAVLLQENATRDGDQLSLNGEGDPTARHIRRAGFDFASEDEVLPAGTRIGPAQLALAISAGAGSLPVHGLPRLAILDSGDELASDPTQCGPNQIPASNGAMLAAMAHGMTSDVLRLGPVPDSHEALAAALEQAKQADVIVTSGGVSVGDHDLIRPALEKWGADLAFWRVAMKPGKPILVARKGNRIIIGLPGNPVSSYVTAYLFLLPILRALAGSLAPLPNRLSARLDGQLPPSGKRLEFTRAIYRGGTVVPVNQQDSSALRSLSVCNALIVRPIDAPAAGSGMDVPIYLLENGGIA